LGESKDLSNVYQCFALVSFESQKIVDLRVKYKNASNFLSTMQSFFKEIGNYILAFLLILGGLVFLYLYVSAPEMEDQPKEMLIAGLFLLVSGIFSLPKVTEKIGTKASRLLMLAFLAIGIYLTYMLYSTVDDEIEFLAEKERIDTEVIQRLKDIRTSEEEFLKVKGYYSNNFDTLAKFIMEPNLAIPWKSGDLHDSILLKPKEIQAQYIVHRDSLSSLGITLEDAIAKGFSVRDTSYASVYDQYFTAEIRKRKGLRELPIDSLPYSPSSGNRFIIKTSSIEVGGGIKRSTLLVQDPNPFGRDGVKKDTLAFGSLTESSTSGNWGNR